MQYIGYYDDEAEAARAYDRAILNFRGPGHRINFPEEQYTPEEIAAAPKVEPQVLLSFTRMSSSIQDVLCCPFERCQAHAPQALLGTIQ